MAAQDLDKKRLDDQQKKQEALVQNQQKENALKQPPKQKAYEDEISDLENVNKDILKPQELEMGLWPYDDRWWLEIIPRIHSFAEDMQRRYGHYYCQRILAEEVEITIKVSPRKQR